MIHMPAFSEKDLAQYLHCFDFASQFKYKTISPEQNYPCYNWYSLVVIPNASNSSTIQNKYGTNLQPGFCDLKIVPTEKNYTSLNEFFPKVASLAGFRKDKTVPRGWMTYQDGTLSILSGKNSEEKSNAPPGTAFDGENKYGPKSESDIVRQMTVEVESLHDLLCIAEGLLDR